MGQIRYDIDKFYNDIKKYLDEKKIRYSSSIGKLLVNGIKIEVCGEEKDPIGYTIFQNHKISFYLSTYNFRESFELYIRFLK